MCSQSPIESSRDLMLTGWIDEHPVDGFDVAHLLLYPRSSTISAEMPLVVDALGLSAMSAGAMPDVPPSTARVTVDENVIHLLYGDIGDLTRPAAHGWTTAAVKQGFVIVTCGTDPLHGGGDALDDYFSSPDRLAWGRLRLVDSAAHPDPAVHVSGEGLAALATAMPLTEEDMIRKAALTSPLQQFFTHQAEAGRAYTMADVGAATGIGPDDVVPLLLCLNMLTEIGILRPGPPAGGAGPTWLRK